MASTAETMIGVANRSQQWLRERPRAVDAGFALLVFTVELIDLYTSNDPTLEREADLLAIVLIALGAGSLFQRRTRPIFTMMAVVVFMVPFYLRDYGSFMSVVGLASFYAVAAHASNRRRAWIVTLAAYVALFTVAVFTVLDRPMGFAYAGAANMTTYIGVASFVGLIARNREQIFVKAEARADRAEADRAQAAHRAATQERLRIARELHDVVAHGMSVIAVQAAAAQEIAHKDPDGAVELMQTVETTGRESLNEMRRMLGVLRNGDGDRSLAGARSPQPSVHEIEDIIAHCRDAGLPTEFAVVGEVRQLSAGLELAIYRIIQEALTNVLKHGGSAAEATVELSYRFTTVLIRVTDTGRGIVSSVASGGAGNGLLGMRERVELYDGTLTAGPKPGGGYEVTAVLPMGDTRRPHVASADGQTDTAGNAPTAEEIQTAGQYS